MKSLLIVFALLAALGAYGQDSLNVTCISQFALWGYCWDVAVSGSYAYVANDNALGVVDISDPAHPRPVAFVSACTGAEALALSEGYLYAVRPESGITVINITNPLHPTIAGQYNTTDWILGGIAVIGSLAVVVDGQATMKTIDFSNPAEPEIRGQLAITGLYADAGIAIQDSLAYIAAENSPLHIVSIRNPSAPVDLGHTEEDLGSAKDVAVSGHYAYVASEYDGLHVVDVGNPAAPVQVANFNEWPFQFEGAAIAGNTLYLASFSGPFRVLDISDPVHPLALSQLDLAPCSSENAVVLQGQTAYTVTECGDLIALDISQPSAPAEIGRWATPAHEAEDIAISGNTLAVSAYWTYYGNGLATFDASDPAHVSYVGHLAGGSGMYPGCVTAHDGLFYVGQCWSDRLITTMDGGFVIVNGTDPAQPRELSELDTLWAVSSIAFSGDYAYVSSDWPESYSGGVSVIDVHDSLHPAMVAAVGPVGWGTLAAADSFLFLTTEQGLKIFDISDPLQITALTVTPLSDISLTAVAVQGHYAYVSSAEDSLYTLDISSASSPLTVSAFAMPHARKIETAGARAYMACDTAGLYILDLSDPARPREIGYYRTPGRSSYGLAVRNDLIYVADGSFIGVYRSTLDNAAKPQTAPHVQHYALSAYPNPFNPNTVLSFDVPLQGRIQLSVYDLTGRLVQTLTDQVYTQGNYQVAFDGAALPSGIYFARLQGNSFYKTQKLVLLK